MRCVLVVCYISTKNTFPFRRKKIWTQPGLNQGPLDLQSNTLPVSYIHMYTPVSEGVIKVLLVRSNYGSTGNKLYPTQFFHICTGTPY